MEFDYYVWDANVSQKAAVDKAMAAIVKSGILAGRFDLSVDIEFVSTAGGGCVDMEDGEFLIEINNRMREASIIATVLHEMVHVKQYAEGRLTQTTWMNEPLPELPYRELPWEVEAWDMEKTLGDFV